MQRVRSTPRSGHEATLRRDGIHAPWDESVHWTFTSDEIETVYAAANEIHEMALAAVGDVADSRLYPLLGLTPEAADGVAKSWSSRTRELDLVTRLSLAWDGTDQPKLVGFQADSPAGLVEAALGQWWWKEELFPRSDQFNSLHEDLSARILHIMRTWNGYRRRTQSTAAYVAYMPDDPIGRGQMEYIARLIGECGLDARPIALPDIGYDSSDGRFVDLDEDEISLLFKFHPWQWLVSDPFGENLLRSCERDLVEVVEPAWKLMLTNKAVMAVLWRRYPHHPNLVETGFSASELLYDQPALAIPKFSDVGYATRSGRVENGRFVCSDASPEGEEGEIVQALAPYAGSEQGIHATFDVWMIGGEAKGMGVRERRGDQEVFVPHRFD